MLQLVHLKYQLLKLVFDDLLLMCVNVVIVLSVINVLACYTCLCADMMLMLRNEELRYLYGRRMLV